MASTGDLVKEASFILILLYPIERALTHSRCRMSWSSDSKMLSLRYLRLRTSKCEPA
jgi:hypothetical protein